MLSYLGLGVLNAIAAAQKTYLPCEFGNHLTAAIIFVPFGGFGIVAMAWHWIDVLRGGKGLRDE